MGNVDAYFQFACDESKLDYIMLLEHDIWLDDGEWQRMLHWVNTFNNPGSFTTFIGYEWAVGAQDGGHHNVMFRNMEGAERVPMQTHPTPPQLYMGLRDRYDSNDVVVIPHAHQPVDWRITDTDLERVVEITSAHGTFEWFGRKCLDQGLEVGLIGSSDDHIGHPGYRPRAGWSEYSSALGAMAATYAAENSRDAIFDAIRARLTYATNGERIILSAFMGEHRMGTRVPQDTARNIAGKAIGTAPIHSITLVKNGVEVETIDYFKTTAAPLAKQWLEIDLWSDSDPYAHTMVPSKIDWRAKLSLSSGRLSEVHAAEAEYFNRHTEYARLTGERGDRSAEFRFITQGESKRILVQVDADSDAQQLNAVFEDGSFTDFDVDLETLRAGPKTITRKRPGGQVDRVRVRYVERPTAMDREYRFNDQGPAKSGDYYYVRVRQTNVDVAWSSPFWVGH
jgi:hypothetical protein